MKSLTASRVIQVACGLQHSMALTSGTYPSMYISPLTCDVFPFSYLKIGTFNFLALQYNIDISLAIGYFTQDL